LVPQQETSGDRVRLTCFFRHIANGHSGTANFLTSANTKSVPGVGFSNSISCDQLAANVLGNDTRHRSLALASAPLRSDGHGGRIGYASWGKNGKPVGVHRNLNDIYSVLFGSGRANPAQVRARLARKQSSLDALVDNAKKLNRQISTSDRERVDEYFTTIRSIEDQLSKAQEWVDQPYPQAPFDRPGRVGGRKEIELTLDLMHVAMQSDSTRVMTYMLPTGPILKELKTRLNPHRMSHFGPGKLDTWEIQKQRDLMLSELVAGFLHKLKDTKEHDGSSLLDHSLVVYGSGLRKGHGSKNGPLLLAGHGGGGLKQGRNLVYKANSTPLSNLWLSMVRHVGVNQERFADSKRVLTEVGFR